MGQRLAILLFRIAGFLCLRFFKTIGSRNAHRVLGLAFVNLQKIPGFFALLWRYKLTRRRGGGDIRRASITGRRTKYPVRSTIVDRSAIQLYGSVVVNVAYHPPTPYSAGSGGAGVDCVSCTPPQRLPADSIPMFSLLFYVFYQSRDRVTGNAVVTSVSKSLGLENGRCRAENYTFVVKLIPPFLASRQRKLLFWERNFRDKY